MIPHGKGGEGRFGGRALNMTVFQAVLIPLVSFWDRVCMLDCSCPKFTSVGKLNIACFYPFYEDTLHQHLECNLPTLCFPPTKKTSPHRT